MTNYRRLKIAGGSYFFTVVTYQRRPWLCDEVARQQLRSAILHVRQQHPFTIDEMVLLPDHLHCIWTLPEGDRDYSIRWSLIKRYVTQKCKESIEPQASISQSRWNRREGTLWQRRFWEYWIRDEADFQRCRNYIHNNPVRHNLCDRPQDWPHSSIHNPHPKPPTHPT
jgi:putative transposase